MYASHTHTGMHAQQACTHRHLLLSPASNLPEQATPIQYSGHMYYPTIYLCNPKYIIVLLVGPPILPVCYSYFSHSFINISDIKLIVLYSNNIAKSSIILYLTLFFIQVPRLFNHLWLFLLVPWRTKIKSLFTMLESLYTKMLFLLFVWWTLFCCTAFMVYMFPLNRISIDVYLKNFASLNLIINAISSITLVLKTLN